MINFKCLLRDKTKKVSVKKETEIIKYKGFKNVEIDKVSQEDKKLFLSKIKQLKDIGIEPSETIMEELHIFDKWKTWYLYSKWKLRNM